ncbi:MAG: hypothetical protein ABI629_22305 [bacterium]
MNRFRLRDVVALLLFTGAVAAGAQDTLRVEELPDTAASTPTEAAATATEVVATPTRRPTRAPTATAEAAATATVIDTPSPAATDAATLTPSPAPAVTATPTSVASVVPSLTATPTVAWLAALGGASIGHDGTVLPLIAGGLLALLATWLGARIAGGRDRRERHRARRSLATAMLLELRRIDAVLRRVVGLDNPASFPSLDHPIMEAALRDLTLFDTEAAARIAQFHGALRGIQHEIGDYRDNPLRWAGRLGELNQLIKSRAAATCRAVPELVKALERAGGAPPPPLGEPASSGADSAGLPPPPFGAGEGDDWTL